MLRKADSRRRPSLAFLGVPALFQACKQTRKMVARLPKLQVCGKKTHRSAVAAQPDLVPQLSGRCLAGSFPRYSKAPTCQCAH